MLTIDSTLSKLKRYALIIIEKEQNICDLLIRDYSTFKSQEIATIKIKSIDDWIDLLKLSEKLGVDVGADFEKRDLGHVPFWDDDMAHQVIDAIGHLIVSE